MNELLKKLIVDRRALLKPLYEKLDPRRYEPEKHWRLRIHPDMLRELRKIDFDQLAPTGMLDPEPHAFGFAWIEDTRVETWAFEEISSPPSPQAQGQ